MRNFFVFFFIMPVCWMCFSCGSAKPCSSPPENSITLDESFIPESAEPPKKKRNCELGATLSSINGDAESYNKPLFGGQVGFSYLFGNGPVGFKPGINVSMAGSKYEDTYVDGSVRLIYLNVPLLANYTTPSGFFAEAGLQPGILLSAKDKYSGSSYNYKDYVSSFDLGVPLGVGYICKSGFGAGARVTPGILNLNKNSSDGKDHNMVFLLRALYNFGGK